ncbi:MAG: HNH endonuclease [Planctomycetes bacterium]|nr:HNH endonuclease [Planctomycetota bacterium]
MNMAPNPFGYPLSRHIRKHGPFGYTNYESYREWLRDEFSFRCVFCLYREKWPSTQTWEIDHLLPRAGFPEKEREYENLIYLCRTCNANKSAKLVPDPCRVALGKCVRVHPDGRIMALNQKGRLLVKALRLDNEHYTRMRQLMIGILQSCARTDRKLLVSLMGYPSDLTDLAKLNPPGNSRPDGVRNCFYAVRARGELPEVY